MLQNGQRTGEGCSATRERAVPGQDSRNSSTFDDGQGKGAAGEKSQEGERDNMLCQTAGYTREERDLPRKRAAATAAASRIATLLVDENYDDDNNYTK